MILMMCKHYRKTPKWHDDVINYVGYYAFYMAYFICFIAADPKYVQSVNARRISISIYINFLLS